MDARFILFLLVSCSLASCSSDAPEEEEEMLTQEWIVQLEGEEFRAQLTAYYSAFGGDLTIVGTKNVQTEERIVLTFSVDDGAPFVENQSLDMGTGSGNSILYFDSSGDEFSTLFDMGSGTFKVSRYIDSDSRNFLSGTFEGRLYDEASNTFVEVTGKVAARTY